MAIPLMSLPGYQTGNTLLNFEPIQRALDQKIRMDQVQQEQAFRQQRADKMDARDDEAALRQRGEAFGNKALAFANLPAEQRDPAAWDRILKDHPDYANLPAQYRDPMKSPDLVAAEFGKFRERSEKDNLRVVGSNLLRVEPGQKPEVLFTAPKEKSTLERLMEMEGVQRNPQPSAPRQYQPMPQTGGPRIQPQSSVGPDVMLGGVTLASDPVEIPQPNASASNPQRPTERMFDIPLFGQKTESEARALAFKLIAGDPEARALGQAINNMLGPQSNPAGLQKPTLNTIEERQFNATEKLSRLQSIKETFKPQYLTGIEQAKQLGMSWQAWLTGSLPPAQAQQRREFVTWQRRTIENVNSTIKEITGAAMSEQEAKRIRMQEADLKNDPVQFEALLDDAIKTTKLSVARLNYLRKNGFEGKAFAGPLAENGQDTELGRRVEQQFPLERMGDVIKRRQMEIGAELIRANPNVDIQQLLPAVKQILKAEFGTEV